MRLAGGSRRDNAGISSVKADGKSARRKPKVSWGREIRSGLVGPKARPKGVVDGQQVNIPAPIIRRLTEAGTQEDSLGLEVVQVQALRLVGREDRSLIRLGCDVEGSNMLNLDDFTLTRKAA